jgi:hypothetical protein
MSEALEKILAELDEPVRAPPKPERPMKLVADERLAEGRRTRAQTVYVSPADPNWRGSNSVVVRVFERPDDWERPCVISEYHPFTRGLR